MQGPLFSLSTITIEAKGRIHYIFLTNNKKFRTHGGVSVTISSNWDLVFSVEFLFKFVYGDLSMQEYREACDSR